VPGAMSVVKGGGKGAPPSLLEKLRLGPQAVWTKVCGV
jgi:hypothetical protein